MEGEVDEDTFWGHTPSNSIQNYDAMQLLILVMRAKYEMAYLNHTSDII